jgi:hypothetical protein
VVARQYSGVTSRSSTSGKKIMKKVISTLGILLAGASLSACISVSESNHESGKQIAIMSQQAIATCGQGNVDKVSTTSFSCKSPSSK